MKETLIYSLVSQESTSFLEILLNEIERSLSSTEAMRIAKRAHYKQNGGHFTEFFARRLVSANGEHWRSEQAQNVYARVNNKLPEHYNAWDWYAALNMIYAEWAVFLQNEFAITQDEADEKIINITIEWLNDVTETEKAWRVLSDKLQF